MKGLAQESKAEGLLPEVKSATSTATLQYERFVNGLFNTPG